ncbi:hypothetical protein MVES_003305 [Malassezia vespertilionis]|uniref:K Homology domain-containing protein n=1 Tax=Malassezia vespertilionis TaxID=2020962 RepID=A0A2N1J8Q7_9BASI|nr:hypothetical protein MVES_003305 [Malassezia vespertilionis]
MAERKSKWDQPTRRENADPSAGTVQVNNDAHKPAARAAAAAAAKIAAQFGRGQGAKNALVRHPEFDEDAPDGAFTHDIEINDHRNRYLLTKSQTQSDLYRETSARVFTRGTWYPDRSKTRPNEPPLHLHITADSRESLDRAIAKVNLLMTQDLPPLLDDRLHRGDVRTNWPEKKIPINLEPLRNFNVRAKIVGPGGLFVKYIQNETRVRTQIKGIGSGYLESDTGRELDEPMHVHLTSPEESQLQRATELATDLVDAVTAEWQKAYTAMGYSNPPPAANSAQGPAPPAPEEPAPPPPPDAEVPPPPEGEVPPPPPTDVPPPADPEPPVDTGAMAAQEEEDETLRQYWKDYVAWERSFVDYHGRRPTAEEGAQDVPPEYRA